MTFWKKNKLKIIIPALIVLALAAAFVFGDRNLSLIHISEPTRPY